MRGRDLLFEAMKQLEIDYLFGNPGTTELPLVDGCAANNIQYVLALHEGIAMGMAMGYARATGKPGVVNLHVAPGLGNGMSNLYNAFRAGLPLVVTAGQHHTEILMQEPILSANLVDMAKPFTKWAFEARTVAELPLAIHRAFKVAMTPPMGPVFLSLPPDVLLQETDAVMPPITPVGARFAADAGQIAVAARFLARAERPLIVSGDAVGTSGAIPELAALAELIGAPVLTEPLPLTNNFYTNHPLFAGALPITGPGFRTAVKDADVIFLAGFTSQAPLTVYDGKGGLFPEGVPLVYLHNNPWEIGKNYPGVAGMLGDPKTTLPFLTEAIRREGVSQDAAAARRQAVAAAGQAKREKLAAEAAPLADRTPIQPAVLMQTLARLVPPDAVLINEALSNSPVFNSYLAFNQDGAYVGNKAGGLSWSPGTAMGHRMGRPDRPVVHVIGDGSFLYYPQSLWTGAKYGIGVLHVVLNNGSYRILRQGLRAMGGPWSDGTPGLVFGEPAIDLQGVAKSFGAAGRRVTDPGELADAIQEGLAAAAAGRPFLLEVVVDPTP
ncbi:MAG TPA: thiamine pyrophosphate-binding protein [Symbiobacteriaceae bacterium]|jgi:benzoylformate decarboxylase